MIHRYICPDRIGKNKTTMCFEENVLLA